MIIQNTKSSATQNGKVTSFGGLIALVDSASAYIKIHNVEVSTTGTPVETYGGLISEGKQCSHFFDIGTSKITGNCSHKNKAAHYLS